MQRILHTYLGFGFRVSGFGFRISGFGFRVSSFGFRVSGFRFQVSGVGCEISGFGFRVPSFGFRVSCFWLWSAASGFRVSGFGFRISGFGFRVYGAGVEAPAAQGVQEARSEEEEKVDAKPMLHVQDDPSGTGDASCAVSGLASDPTRNKSARLWPWLSGSSPQIL